MTHHVLVKNPSTRDFSGEFVDCIEIIDNDCDGARASETSSLSTSARVGVGVGVKVASNTKFYEEDMKLPAVVKNRPEKKVKYQMGYEGGDKLAKRRIDPCHHWQNGLENDDYFDWEIITMNANVGVLLVIGFPLALLACLWVFGKVSVRPE